MTNVYVEEEKIYGTNLTRYRVMVDGKQYDEMTLWSGPSLTWSQQADVAAGYKEYLDHSPKE